MSRNIVIEKKNKEKILFNNEDPDISNDSISSSVTLRENALSECIIRANDEEGAMFLSTVKLYDVISVKYAYEEDEGNLENESDWNNIEPIFKGWVIELTPSLTREGEVVSITAMNGLGLKMMRVAHEYGTQVITDTYEATNDNFGIVSFDNVMSDNWTTNGDNPYLNDSEDNYIQLELLEVYNDDEIGRFIFNNVVFNTYDIWMVTELKIQLRCRITGEQPAYIRPILRYASGSYWIPDNKAVTSTLWDNLTWDFTDRLIEISDFKTFLSQLAVSIRGGIMVEESSEYLQVCEAYVIVSGTAWNSGGLFTLREILTDVDNGIVPKYIEKILNTDNNSGYSLNTDYIYNDTLEYAYLNFPYQDAFMCLQDIIRLGCSMHYIDNPSDWGNPSGIHTGLHWIIQYDKDLDEHLLLIASVGNHNVTGLDENYTIEDKWSTRPIDNPTIVVRQDIVTQSFKTELPIANYVLVAGKYIRPVNELWTESINGWEAYSNPSDKAHVGLSAYHEAGSTSLKMLIDLTYPTGTIGWFIHPIADDKIDFTDLVSKNSNVNIHFKFNNGGYTGNHCFLLMTDINNYLKYDLTGLEQDKFNEFNIEITSEFIKIILNEEELPEGWTEIGNFEITNVNYIGFKFREIASTTVQCLVDDFYIEGNIIRGIYDQDSIDTYGCRFLTIKDSMASTDTLSTDDYTSPLAQLAIYELLRNRVVRTTGQISIPLNPDIKAGQLIHIHACATKGVQMTFHSEGYIECIPSDIGKMLINTYTEKEYSELISYNNNNRTWIIAYNESISGGSWIAVVDGNGAGQLDGNANVMFDPIYNIDKDFRITEVRHDFTIQGAFTLLTLTDDLYNSIPINSIDPYSQVMRAINPDYQTRTYASLKISDGDFTADMKPITSPLPT